MWNEFGMILEKKYHFVPGVSGGGNLKNLLPGVVDMFFQGLPERVAIFCTQVSEAPNPFESEKET